MMTLARCACDVLPARPRPHESLQHLDKPRTSKRFRVQLRSKALLDPATIRLLSVWEPTLPNAGGFEQLRVGILQFPNIVSWKVCVCV